MPKRQRGKLQGSVTEKGYSSVSSSLGSDVITVCADGWQSVSSHPGTLRLQILWPGLLSTSASHPSPSQTNSDLLSAPPSVSCLCLRGAIAQMLFPLQVQILSPTVSPDPPYPA